MSRNPRALRWCVAIAAAAARFVGLTRQSSAQSTIWDSAISNTHWYVPVPQLLGYAAPAVSFANPIPIGDQTLWTLGTSTNGAFTGTSVAQLAIGPSLQTQTATIQGFVSTSGQIVMVFTPVGPGATTVGLGLMKIVGGVPMMEMQMITGETLLVTHWANMLPYNPATFTPPASQVVFADSSPQWNWTAKTPWRIVSPDLFGTTAPGRFIITDYVNGYFWGRGIGPAGSAMRTYTLLGSITPEGKVLFNTLSGGKLTSLYGGITGDASAAQMAVTQYDLTGALTGAQAYLTLVQPFPDVVAASGNRASLGAAQALYRIANSAAGFGDNIAAAIDALSAMSTASLPAAISQTVPVLAGAASQATATAQRALRDAVTDRLDARRGAGPIDGVVPEQAVWLRPLGGVVRQDARDGVPGYRANGAGVVAGIDSVVTPALTLGGLIAYSHYAFTGSDDAVPNKLGVGDYQFGLYGTYALRPGLALDFQFDAGANRNASDRSITWMSRIGALHELRRPCGGWPQDDRAAAAAARPDPVGASRCRRELSRRLPRDWRGRPEPRCRRPTLSRAGGERRPQGGLSYRRPAPADCGRRRRLQRAE